MRIVLLGDQGSGKSSFMNHLRGWDFEEEYKESQAIFLVTKGENTITDIGGSSRYDEIRKPYLRGAEKVFLFLDGSEPLGNVERWRELWLRCCPEASLSVVVTKIDLPQLLRLPTWLEGRKTFYVSSKLGTGIEELKNEM